MGYFQRIVSDARPKSVASVAHSHSAAPLSTARHVPLQGEPLSTVPVGEHTNSSERIAETLFPTTEPTGLSDISGNQSSGLSSHDHHNPGNGFEEIGNTAASITAQPPQVDTYSFETTYAEQPDQTPSVHLQEVDSFESSGSLDSESEFQSDEQFVNEVIQQESYNEMSNRQPEAEEYSNLYGEGSLQSTHLMRPAQPNNNLETSKSEVHSGVSSDFLLKSHFSAEHFSNESFLDELPPRGSTDVGLGARRDSPSNEDHAEHVDSPSPLEIKKTPTAGKIARFKQSEAADRNEHAPGVSAVKARAVENHPVNNSGQRTESSEQAKVTKHHGDSEKKRQPDSVKSDHFRELESPAALASAKKPSAVSRLIKQAEATTEKQVAQPLQRRGEQGERQSQLAERLSAKVDKRQRMVAKMPSSLKREPVRGDVHIGSVDVVIQAPAAVAKQKPTSSAPDHLGSRYYIRGL